MWFTETAGPPILIFSLIAAAYFIAWYGNRRLLYLIIIGVMALLSLGTYIAEKLIITDLERVEQNIQGVTNAFKEGDFEETMSYFAQNVQNEYGSEVERGFLRIKVLRLRLTGIEIEMKNENTRAISRFRANATILVDSTTEFEQPTFWEVTWEKQGGEWKIIKAVPLHPKTGEPTSY